MSSNHPEDLHIPIEPFTLVMFGASGDLSRRMLIPAIYNLFADGFLPERFLVVGSSRSLKSVADFHKLMRDSIMQHSRRPIDESTWQRLIKHCDHLTGDPRDLSVVEELGVRLAEAESEIGTGGRNLFHLATPPESFTKIIEQLRESGLLHASQPKDAHWPKIMIEKPFGLDLQSACDLNSQLAAIVNEKQIYRVDHYLGKETVQNLIVFRFANSIFEPVWNRSYVDYVEITAAEKSGVGNRGKFYEGVGAVRDVLQNHVLQMLALCTMEPPTSYYSGLDAEKLKVFSALRRMTVQEAAENVVLGQYEGYLQAPNVAPDSRTPTYAAARMFIDNWRWQGVPFYLRTGKCLARKVTEIAVHFKSIPFCMFGRERVCSAIEHNMLVMRISPDEGITLRMTAKAPGEDFAVDSTTMDFRYAEAFERARPDAYEHLMVGCIRADHTLFAQRESVELEWEIVMPILDHWGRDDRAPLFSYKPGSAGPKEAERLVKSEGKTWRPLNEQT